MSSCRNNLMNVSGKYALRKYVTFFYESCFQIKYWKILSLRDILNREWKSVSRFWKGFMSTTWFFTISSNIPVSVSSEYIWIVVLNDSNGKERLCLIHRSWSDNQIFWCIHQVRPLTFHFTISFLFDVRITFSSDIQEINFEHWNKIVNVFFISF